MTTKPVTLKERIKNGKPEVERPANRGDGEIEVKVPITAEAETA
jgi:hypothetical protein